MSDIVERLRGTREWVGFPAVPICAEAADEIERLRGASADLATENERLGRGIRSIYDYLVAGRTGDALFDCEALLCGSQHEVRP